MKTEIVIACGYEELVPVDAIDPFQGGLKQRGDLEYQKFKAEVLEDDFSFPLFCWLDPSDGRRKAMDGHGRMEFIPRMIAEGFSFPGYPVVYIQARDRKQAKRKLLAVNARYGRMTNDGLYSYAEEAGLSFEEVSLFDLPEINFTDLKVQFENDGMLVPDATEEPGPTLKDRFLIAPFSTLNAREGWWQDRKRKWIALGIKSELGRGGASTPGLDSNAMDTTTAEPSRAEPSREKVSAYKSQSKLNRIRSERLPPTKKRS